MDISVLIETMSMYIVPVIVVVCLLLGFFLKHGFSKLPNDFIPAILAVIGVLVSAWHYETFNLNVFITGLVSAAAACGLHNGSKDSKTAITDFVTNFMKWLKT